MDKVNDDVGDLGQGQCCCMRCRMARNRNVTEEDINLPGDGVGGGGLCLVSFVALLLTVSQPVTDSNK